jgi:hypothetical protein
MNNDRMLPVISKTGAAAAIILFIAYVLIPAVVLLGIVKG